MEPLVSVIIPVYQVLPYLQESIDSVLHQTYSNLEILIVDDGSTDGSGAVCDEYAKQDARVRVIHQENRGLSCARNAGLDAASGELIAFLDSDDAYMPEMISRLVDALQQAGADIACCGFTRHCTEGKLHRSKMCSRFQPEEGSLSSAEALHALVDGRLNYSVWNRVYRRSIWQNLRFPAGRNYEDLAVAFELFERAAKTVVLPDLLMMYRIRNGSICRTLSLKNLQDWFEAHNDYLQKVESHPDSFTQAQLQHCRDHHLRVMILVWAQYRKSLPGGKAQKGLEQSIRELREKLPRLTPKTGAAWLLFRCCPGLIQPASAAWGAFRRLLRI